MYSIKNYKNEEMAKATEKRVAIRLCKLYALKCRQSMYLFSENGYIGVAKFPKYFKGTSSIYFYKDILPF